MATALAIKPEQKVTSVLEDRRLLERLFADWQRWPGKEAKFEIIPVLDEKHDRYLLLTVGWDGYKRIHSLLVHIHLKNDKFWIEEDNTEEGFATDLLEAGVPKDRIVLAFQHIERRKWGEFPVE